MSGLALTIIGAVSLSAGMLPALADLVSVLDILHEAALCPHEHEVTHTALKAALCAHQPLAVVAVWMASDVEIVLDVKRLVAASAPASDGLPAI